MKYLTRRHYILALIVLCIGVFVWSAAIAASGTVGPLEVSFFRLINNMPSAFGDIMLVLTQMGNVLFFLLCVAMLWLWRRRGLALRLLLVGIATHLIIDIAKVVIGRDRPIHLLVDVQERDLAAVGFGFPSGHIAVATVLALMAILYLRGKWRFAALLLIPIVAFTRLYLGVHMPLDIVGGIAVATLVTSGFWIVDKKTTKS